jgi:hypothetical protein
MSDVLTIEPEKKSSRPLFILVGLLVAFLLGFIPMWMKARDQGTVREKAEHELTLMRIVKDLGAAATNTRRPEWKPAHFSRQPISRSISGTSRRSLNSSVIGCCLCSDRAMS